jgi:ribosomal protein S24E
MTYKDLGVLMLEVHFFKNDSGAEPVREWLKNELSKDDRLIIVENIKTEHMNGRFNMRFDKFANVYRKIYEKVIHDVSKN